MFINHFSRKGIAAALIMMLSLSYAQPVLAESAAEAAVTTASAESVTTATKSSEQKTVVITAGYVNLRSGAGTSFAKVGKAKKGNRFAYLSSKKAKDGKLWYQIQYTSSKKAWVLNTYAKRANNDASFSPYLTRTITIKKGSKSVYSEPDAKSKRMGKVSGGKKYTVTGWGEDGKNTWYSFRLKGKQVWISRKEVNVSDQFKSIPTKDFSNGGVPMIYLSPSKQPKNNYAAGNTNEQKQMYRVAADTNDIEARPIARGIYLHGLYRSDRSFPVA